MHVARLVVEPPCIVDGCNGDRAAPYTLCFDHLMVRNPDAYRAVMADVHPKYTERVHITGPDGH